MTTLFEGLFDDAALFPPGEASMATAVPAHRQLQRRFGGLVGPLVIPADRLDELTDNLGAGEPLGVALIAAPAAVAAATARITAEPRLRLAAIEVPLVSGAAAAREVVQLLATVAANDLPVAVEIPRSDTRNDVLDILAATTYRAKLRTGGLHPELFPSPTELASTLHACVTRGMAVKCTAGLHHAVRHTDPATGFPHHGFLNLLTAAEALASGADPAMAADLLAETDPYTLVAKVRSWPHGRAAHARAVFTSFGTCSVLEPIDDLHTLGLLGSTERSRA